MLTGSALLSIIKRRSREAGSSGCHVHADEVFLFTFASLVYARFVDGRRTA
jgi:hypothetical protein